MGAFVAAAPSFALSTAVARSGSRPSMAAPRSLPIVLVALFAVALGTSGCPRGGRDLQTLPVVTTDDPVAEADLRAAREAAEAGRLEEANRRYQTFLRDHARDPLVPLAHLGLGRLALAEGNAVEAKRRFAHVAEHPDASLAERGRFYIGVAHHVGGDHAKAIELLSPFLGRTVDPADTTLLLRTMAAASLALGDRVKTIEMLDRLARPGMPEAERNEARKELLPLVEERASADETQTLYDRLPREGEAWPLVARRAAREAYAAGDFGRVRAIIDGLKARDVPLDEELQTLALRAERSGKADPGVIGAILPLSGRGREVGQLALRGLMMATGGPGGSGQAPQIVFRDDAGDPERAARAVEDLASLHRVIAIVGPIDGAAATAAAKRAQELGVPLLTLSPNESVTRTGPMVFRLLLSPREEARELVSAARGRSARRFAVLHPESPYGTAMRDAFAAEVRAQGGELVTAVGYEPGTTSFTKKVGELKAHRLDAIFVPDAARELALIAPALAAAGLWVRPDAPTSEARTMLLAPSVAFSAELVRDAGRYLQGSLFSQPFHLGTAGDEFGAKFESRYGMRADTFAAYAYDALDLVRHAVEAGAKTREDLAERLTKTRGASTVGGSGGFLPERTPARGTRIYELRGSELKLVPAVEPPPPVRRDAQGPLSQLAPPPVR